MTSFDDIYDLITVTIRDYKLDKIYSVDIDTFQTIMKGYLLKAIPVFNNSKTNLEDVDLELNVFNNTLSLSEKVILSNLAIIEWMNSKILDVTQMQLHLNDTDFKHYAESQNLSAKINAREVLRETANQQMTDYGIKNIPWSEWASGNFYG